MKKAIRQMERIKYFSEYLDENDNFEIKMREALYLALPIRDKEYLSINELNEYNINESFIDRINTRGKKVLDSIIRISKNISDFLSKIKNDLTKYLSTYFSSARSNIKKKLLKDKKIEDLIKEKINADRIAFVNDLRTCKNVFNFYTNDFFAGFINNIVHSLRSHFLSKSVTESLVNEALNVESVDKVVITVTEKPPFVWLTEIHEIASKGVDKLIALLSWITTKLGGPSFVLPVMASIIGLYLEHGTESLITAGIVKAIEFFTIPFVALIIEFISHVALILTIYELCVEISSSIDKFEERHKHHHKKTPNNGKQTGPETLESNI